MPLTRFAPSPTGLLHLGHVVNALYVWGLGRARGAEVLLRIEDHDRQRSRPEYEAQLLDDLDWLGFRPDRFPTAMFRAGRCDGRQSDRGALYEQTARDLAARGLLYGCRCSRSLIAQQGGDSDVALTYPGTCRDRAIGLDTGVAWRLRLEAGADEPVADLLLSPEDTSEQGPVGDPVIRDRLGQWTYQFAVTVDDFHQGVDLVIRGRDLAPSTRLQLRLAQILGRTKPAQFAHHPLVMTPTGRKLSKSQGDTGISALRRSGLTPADVIGRAAGLAGLAGADARIAAEQVGDLFVGPRP
jgi:glutamyl-Q tRNA(Asp) synthetase